MHTEPIGIMPTNIFPCHHMAFIFLLPPQGRGQPAALSTWLYPRPQADGTLWSDADVQYTQCGMEGKEIARGQECPWTEMFELFNVATPIIRPLVPIFSEIISKMAAPMYS